MAKNIQQLPANVDTRDLAEYIRPLIDAVNALLNMDVRINGLSVRVTVHDNNGAQIGQGSGEAQGSGKLLVGSADSTLVLD